MKIIDRLPSPSLTKPRAAMVAGLAALSLSGCSAPGGDKTFNFAAACSRHTTLEVTDVDQIAGVDLSLSCVDGQGNLSLPGYVDQLDKDNDLYETTKPNFKLSVTVNEGGNLVSGWLAQPVMGFTLAKVEQVGSNPEDSLSINNVDALKSVDITPTTAQHYNVVN
jgi:hypothetical protein